MWVVSKVPNISAAQVMTQLRLATQADADRIGFINTSILGTIAFELGMSWQSMAAGKVQYVTASGFLKNDVDRFLA
jgi:hypothetical protein